MHLEGPHGKVKAECRQRKDLGHKSLLVTIDGEEALGFCGYGLIGQFKPKEWGFSKSRKGYIGHMGAKRQEGLLTKGLWNEVSQGQIFACI